MRSSGCADEVDHALLRAALLAISDSLVEPALETTFERLDPWAPRETRIDCIVDEAFSPWMLSPLAVRYVPRSQSQ